MRLIPLSTFTLLLPLVFADVKFSKPPAGSTIIGGGAISIAWGDSGAAPSLADLTSYQLFLVAGGQDDPSQMVVGTPISSTFAESGNQAEMTVPIAAGGKTTNAYFIKMVSVDATGGQVINYSSRFTLSGMTGAFPQNVLTGMESVTGNAGPPTKNQVGAANPVAGAAEFALPWSMQTGLTKYASMQPYPPTKIVAKTKTPLFPTSPYTIATAFMPHATIETTVTQPVTWTFSQEENQVCETPEFNTIQTWHLLTIITDFCGANAIR